MKSRLAQYILITLILSGLTGGWFYYRGDAAQKINSSKVNNLTSGLVGYWTFDGADMTANTALDKTVNGNTGTLTGTTRSIGKAGQSLNFNGSSEYVSVNNSASLGITGNEVSISTWIKYNGAATDYYDIVSKGAVDYGLALDPNKKVYFEILTTTNWKGGSFGSALTQNTWYHVAAIYNGSNMYVYVNGVLQSGTLSWNGNLENTGAMTIGDGLMGGANRKFNGSIDEVRVYNRALSASEITELYQQGQTKINASEVGKLTNGLVGHWTFDGADTNIGTNTTNDKSSGGRNGTLSGATKPAQAIGKIGQGLNFDGTNSYVDVTSFTQSVGIPVSYGTWIKLNATPSEDKYMIVKSGSYFLKLNATSVTCAEDNSAQVGVTKTISLVPGEWYHIFCVIKATGVADGFQSIYINGTDSGAVGTGFAPSDYGDSLQFGMYYGANYFNGQMDEVRVYNKILTDSEILELYQQGQTKINASQTNKLTNGLVGYWTMDGQDTSWSGNTATLTNRGSASGSNGTSYNMSQSASPTIGKVGQAFSFDGIDDYVDVGNSVHAFGRTDPVSFSFWFYPKTGIGQISFITKEQNDVPYGLAIIFKETNKKMWIYYDYDDTVGNQMRRDSSISFIEMNKWSHVGITYDGSGDANGITFYANGAANASTTVFNNLSGNPVNSANLIIGASLGYSYAKANLDEVRVYNRALSQSEVTELYNMGR